LNGFSFTYSGSRPGAIVNGLIDTGSMNSIFFFDELDKISTTNDGIDIQNMLIHLTDPVQNNDFQDKYFEGVPIDLSKIIFIFSFNDIGLISPILKDRLHIIKVPDPDIKEKVIIGTKYLTKELYPNIGLKDEDIVFSENIMRYIINEHCEHDKGVRNLKRCIETILLKINTARFIGKRNKYKSLKGKLTFPTQVTSEMVDELIDKHKDSRDEFVRSMFI
jgi:ATP-dependent Lon protease